MICRPLTIIAVAALGFIAWAPHPAAASSRANSSPQQYYLALGDSLAFGFQLAKFDAQLGQYGTVSPTAFTTGYVDDFAQRISSIQPTIQTMNYGCPGETSAQFLAAAGCPTYPFPLHAGYAGSQMASALAFLHAHPGQVSPITLDIGTNDVEDMVQQCGGYTTASLPCVFAALPGVLVQVSQHLNQIVGELRAAAPSSRIIVMQYYNPIAVNTSLALPSDVIVQALNVVIAEAAGAHGARLADTFQPFNLGPQPQTLCALTLICTPLQDIHPSDAGYQVIAQQFWSASGYVRAAE